MANPNRSRALVGSFAMNQWAFHRRGGEGYRFVADMIIDVDRLNPQVAARLVPPLGRWRRFAEDRAALMRGRARADPEGAGTVEGRLRAGEQVARLV